MPIFRPGKPWALLELTSPKTQAAGLQAISWDSVSGDGDFTWPGANNSELWIEVAGLYLLTLAVARDAIAVSSEATARLRVAGVDVVGTRSPASTTAIYMGCSHVRQLAAGHVVQGVAQLSSGATAGFQELGTSLGVTRIGPVRWT